MQTEDGGAKPALTVAQIVDRQRQLIATAQGDTRPTPIREIAQRTAERDPDGVGVGHQHISNTMRGRGGVTTASTLARIARGIAVTDTETEAQRLYIELMGASGRSEIGPLNYVFTDRWRELGRVELQAVDALINSLAAARERGAREERARLMPQDPDTTEA